MGFGSVGLGFEYRIGLEGISGIWGITLVILIVAVLISQTGGGDIRENSLKEAFLISFNAAEVYRLTPIP